METARPSVFVSYPSVDGALAAALTSALRDAGVDPWLDTERMRFAERWDQVVKPAIDAARAVILLTSPEFQASQPCQDELSYAARQNKRLLTVRVRPTPDVPVALRDGVRVDLAAIDQAAAVAGTLVRWASEDSAQLDQHARLLTAAVEEAAGHRGLLVGLELTRAVAWQTGAPKAGAPGAPTVGILELIARSRRARAVRRAWGAAVSLLGAASVVFGAATWSARVAEQRRNAALVEARFAETLATSGLDRALRLAADAYDASPSAETQFSLGRVLAEAPRLHRLFDVGPGEVAALSFRGETHVVAFTAAGERVEWALDTGARTATATGLDGARAGVQGWSGPGVALVVEGWGDRALLAWSDGRMVPIADVGGVTDVSWTPDARWMAIATHRRAPPTPGRAPDLAALGTHALEVWSTDPPRRVESVGTSTGGLLGLALAPDLAWLAWSDQTYRVQWRTRGSATLSELPVPRLMLALAARPGDDHLTMLSGAEIAAYRPSAQEELTQWTQPFHAAALAWSPAGDVLAVGGLDGDVQLRAGADLEPLAGGARPFRAAVEQVAFSAEGRWWATAWRGGRIAVWRRVDERPVFDAATGAPEPVYGSIHFVDDPPRLLAVLPGGHVEEWTREGTRTRAIRRSGEVDEHLIATAVATDRAGAVVYVAPADGPLLALRDGALVPAAEGRDVGEVQAIAVDAGGGTLAIATSTAVLVRRGGAVRCRVEHARRVVALALAPSGARLAVVEERGPLDVLDTETCARVKRVEGRPPIDRAVTFDADARRIAYALEDGAVRVEPLVGDDVGPLLPSYGVRVSEIAFDAGGGRVAFGDVEGQVHLWDVRVSAPLAPPRPTFRGYVERLRFEAGDRLVAVDDRGHVVAWAVGGGAWAKEARRLAGRGQELAMRHGEGGPR